MKILLTGANGFLGLHLTRLLLENGYELIATGTRDQSLFSSQAGFIYVKMDITDPFGVHDVFEKYKPGVVIHAAAMTLVDEAEKDQWKAFSINVEGTLTLLANAETCRSFFVFIS